MTHFILMMGSPQGGAAQGGNPILGFLPLIAIIFIMYFLMIRPQAKRQKEHRNMLDNLKKGDKVITAGGIMGTIAGIRDADNMLIVKIADNVKVEITRSSVSQVLTKSE